MSAPGVGDPVLVLCFQRDGATTRRAHATGVFINQKDGTTGFFWRAVPPSTTENIEILEHEGLRWARGWDTETEGALLAAWTLSL